MKSVLFYHAFVYKGSKFLSLSSEVSFPCVPGTCCLGLTDQSCDPSSPGSLLLMSTCSSDTQCLQSCNISNAAGVRALLLRVKLKFPLWLPAASPTPLDPWPKFLHSLRFMSHPEPASQLRQSQQPYPSWSFIWYCLKGTRGSSRS